ncbi:hypothetical protein H0H93_011995 [Arthromyces matolae]|nr:hypothetical protein H0H93_011995 [Arthromyces matolae]
MPSLSHFQDESEDSLDLELSAEISNEASALEVPDDSSELEELTSDDFPVHFSERNGRLFTSSGSYPLPVDTPEQERLNVIHRVLRQLIGANYVGPVPEALAPLSERQPLALDICTGNGLWLTDMASEFPHAQFRGFDIVPIATRYPPSNVQFEIQDVNTPYRWRTGSVDFVHARSVSMAVSNFSAVLEEVGRVLRPGGLFLSCEWGWYPSFHPALGLDPSEHAPGISGFFDALNQALDTFCGLQPIAGTVPQLLTESGYFMNITPSLHYVPVGAWHTDLEMQSLGRAFRATLVRYADSVKPLLRDAGWTEVQIGGVMEAFLHDLRTVRGLVAVFHTVHARRL